MRRPAVLPAEQHAVILILRVELTGEDISDITFDGLRVEI